jgi:hypothetical protein
MFDFYDYGGPLVDENKKAPIGCHRPGRKATTMNTDTDLNELDPFEYEPELLTGESLTANEKKAAELILRLQETLGGTVSSRRNLNCATRLLYSLESLGITPASLAYQELDRLRRVWKKRLIAQEDIDRWMIAHGHPIC